MTRQRPAHIGPRAWKALQEAKRARKRIANREYYAKRQAANVAAYRNKHTCLTHVFIGGVCYKACPDCLCFNGYWQEQRKCDTCNGSSVVIEHSPPSMTRLPYVVQNDEPGHEPDENENVCA